MTKKKSGWGAPYSSMEKRFLCGDILAVLPVSKTGCEKVATGNPNMPQEVKEAKMAWVQLRTKCECTTGSSDEEEEDVVEEAQKDEEFFEGKDKKEEGVGVLMTQTMPSLLLKKVIDVDTETSDKDYSDMLAFEERTKKRRKKTNEGVKEKEKEKES
eukprot:207991-Ditylum_brightwellii.AAC.1